jgi:GH24 family phage-related lysozyme (muramidase)
VSKTPVVPAVAVGAAAVVVSTGALAKIKSHEGFRSSAYYDPRKDASGKVLEEHYSVGYGHQITKEEINQGYIDTGTKKIPVVGKNGSDTSMSKEDAEALLKKDYEKFERYAKAIPNFSKLNAEAQMALIDMTYNMGVGWLEAKWPSLKKQLQDMDLQGAAENIRGSLYAQQTRDRAFKNAEAIQTGTKNLEPTNVPAPNNIGTNIDATSKENKQLNQDLHEQPGGSTVINQTNISSSQPQTQQRPTESSNDKSAYERKSRLK